MLDRRYETSARDFAKPPTSKVLYSIQVTALRPFVELSPVQAFPLPLLYQVDSVSIGVLALIEEGISVI